MKKIQLGGHRKGSKIKGYALVDNEDFKKVNHLNWHFHSMGYAQSQKNKKPILMHRLIKNTPQKMETDHINGDRLDNRKNNLRICNRLQNCRNTRLPSHNTSGFKGVALRKDCNRWRAFIKVNQKQIHLGHFNNKIDAIKAYNQKAFELFGEFAKINFPLR